MDLILNLVYLVIYLAILVLTIFVSFYVLKILYNISAIPPINHVVGKVRDYTLTPKQPLMALPNYVFIAINTSPCHKVYLLYLAGVLFILIIIIIFWLLGMIIQKIFLLGDNPFSKVDFPLPWATLNNMKFFTWLFEKTMIDKNEDIIMFFLNIFRAALKPEEYKEAKKRCLENYVSTPETQPNPFANMQMLQQLQQLQPYKEYIDYNLNKEYAKDRLDDTFYTQSYISIKHREAANKYRMMTIIRPDTVNDFRMPDMGVEGSINIGKSYMYI